MDFDPTYAQVIAKRERTLPALRHAWPSQCLQNRSRVVVAERNRNDARLIAAGSLNILVAGRIGQIKSRSNAWSFRIARVFEEILHGAALDAGLRTPRADGVGVALVIAVVLRIGIDQYADGTALLSEIDFHAAEVDAVPANPDLAVQVDVLRRELIKILEPSVIC